MESKVKLSFGKKYYLYKGKYYSRRGLYKKFDISAVLAYAIIRKYKCDLVDVIKYKKLYLSRIGKRNPIECRRVNRSDESGFEKRKEIRSLVNYEQEYISVDVICSEFSCANKLSIQEQLFGNKCINHSKK